MIRKPTLLLMLALLPVLVGVAAAEVLSPPSGTLTLPPPAANAFSVSVAFGPTDGLAYVWDGAAIRRQNSIGSDAFTSLGNVGSGSADAGSIAFSRNGNQLLVGNGAGGGLGGANNGLLFTVPSAGGSSNTPVATVMYHDSFLAAPLGASTTKFFIDRGNATFTGSTVSALDYTNGSNIDLIANIPGASASMAYSPSGQLIVGIGFGPDRGTLRSFAIADLENAYNTATPLDWNAGQVFNSLDNNSGAGLFIDARGYLFAGGPNGITVFDTLGHPTFYDNSGFTSIVYNSLLDQVFVSGFGDQTGLYSASAFVVPEPTTAALALVAAAIVIPAIRRRRAR